MLKIENIKRPPGADMAALTAEASRLLKVREKEVTHLRVLRRSIDGRKDVSIVYSVEVAVKEEPTVLKRCHNKKVSRVSGKPGSLLPSPMPEPDIPPEIRRDPDHP